MLIKSLNNKIKENYKNRKQKRHNRPSEIRLSGVQSIMPIKSKKYIIKKV